MNRYPENIDRKKLTNVLKYKYGLDNETINTAIDGVLSEGYTLAQFYAVFEYGISVAHESKLPTPYSKLSKVFGLSLEETKTGLDCVSKNIKDMKEDLYKGNI